MKVHFAPGGLRLASYDAVTLHKAKPAGNLYTSGDWEQITCLICLRKKETS